MQRPLPQTGDILSSIKNFITETAAIFDDLTPQLSEHPPGGGGGGGSPNHLHNRRGAAEAGSWIAGGRPRSTSCPRSTRPNIVRKTEGLMPQRQRGGGDWGWGEDEEPQPQQQQVPRTARVTAGEWGSWGDDSPKREQTAGDAATALWGARTFSPRPSSSRSLRGSPQSGQKGGILDAVSCSVSFALGGSISHLHFHSSSI